MHDMLRKRLQRRILTVLIENECVLSALYQVYAVKCPKNQDLWEQLAKEEEKHAGLLRSLEPLLEVRDLIASPETFKCDEVQAMSQRIIAMTADSRDRSVEEGAALINAITLESSFREGSAFEVAADDRSAFANIARTLARYSEAHRIRLEKRWKAHEQQRLAPSAPGA